MKEDLTELVVVLDKSGSMSTVISDAIGGFNTFLKAQQEAPGEAKITVVQFDTVLEFYATNADVKSVKPLNEKTYVPRGNTALYDAVGIAIDETGKRLAALDEKDRPSKVIFAILTDGEENSSSKYTGKQVREMLAHQRDKYNWDFVFLAAGEGAFKEAENFGMSMSKTLSFMNTGANQKKSYETLTAYAVNARSMDASEYKIYSSSVNLQDEFAKPSATVSPKVPKKTPDPDDVDTP